MKISQINKLQDLAPSLTGNFTDMEPSPSVLGEYSKKAEAYKKLSSPLLRKYFFYGLHDSPIISLKKNNKNLQITLNDGAYLEMACALINKYKLNIPLGSLSFPLIICSKGTRHLSLNTVDCQSGQISPCRFRPLDEYLYEEVITWQPGNIELAFDLWKNKSKTANRYLLLLACTDLDLRENQLKAWRGYFGDKFDKYLQSFEAKREKGIYLADYAFCQKIIEECQAKPRL